MGETCLGLQQVGKRDLGHGGAILEPVHFLCPAGLGAAGRGGGRYLRLAGSKNSGNNNNNNGSHCVLSAPWVPGTNPRGGAAQFLLGVIPISQMRKLPQRAQ